MASSRKKRNNLLKFTVILLVAFSLLYTVNYLNKNNVITFPRATQNPKLFENGEIQVWDSRVFPGIIDLFYNTGSEWEQYNNIVPIARVNGVWANAEIDKATITTTNLGYRNGIQRVKYQFAKLSNGAHFYLIMEMKDGERKIEFAAHPEPDSARIEAFSLANYYGLANQVRYIEVNGQVLDAWTYPEPAGSYYEQGDFYALPSPQDRTIIFWGEGRIEQFQKVTKSLQNNDVVMTEVRKTPWLPDQPRPENNWFETVHITRDPATLENNVWIFGWEPRSVLVPPPSASPYPVPSTTEEPTPSPSDEPYLICVKNCLKYGNTQQAKICADNCSR